MKMEDTSFTLRHDRTIRTSPPHHDGAIVRHIASFLTLSDAASMGGNSHSNLAQVTSWSSLRTPDTPGLMALSPDENSIAEDDVGFAFDDDLLQRRLQDRQRRYVTQKLAAAVFAHPQSLRQFCVKAHNAATDIRKAREPPPETLRELREDHQPNLLQLLLHSILQNLPLSIAIHLLDAVRETLFDTAIAGIEISFDCIHTLIASVARLLNQVWSMLTNLQFSSATEVFATGLQSVATGVPSALNRLSRDQYGFTDVSCSMGDTVTNRNLIEKLSAINSAAHVITYREREDEALTKHAKKRVQKMMHYDVSLRPFFATVVVPQETNKTCMSSFGRFDLNSSQNNSPLQSPTGVTPPSPFMCTPKSFPPSPDARFLVMARSTRFTEDVIFLARDKLRVEDGLDSDNDRTRAMAVALRDANRLAVFNAADIGGGIVLSCGQHVATKDGNVLYCSTRSMIPVLRNCYAYFEMTVLPRANATLPTSMATLSIGLSTLEMPLNTLVGAWKGSVGLCTTGQILRAGQWCSSLDPSQSSYGDSATVGCLVHLDDHSAFETWDGVMVVATLTFNVNGQIVPPPIQTEPVSNKLPTIYNPSTLALLVPAEEELFPTVTLHSPGTQVMCRFSSEDLRATWREHVGAPPGVVVYAIDGSVMFGCDEGCRPNSCTTDDYDNDEEDDVDDDDYDDDDIEP